MSIQYVNEDDDYNAIKINKSLRTTMQNVINKKKRKKKQARKKITII